MTVSAYLVEGHGKTILFDGGGGGINGWRGRLHTALAAANVDPRQINQISLTHAHPDHIGGLVSATPSAPLFPNAELVLHEKEFKFWSDDGNLSRAPDAVQPFFTLPEACSLPTQRVGSRSPAATSRRESPSFTSPAGSTSSTSVVRLVEAALGLNAAVRERRRRLPAKAFLESLVEHIQMNIADLSLSPAAVAARFRASPRYLHKVLENGGQSFGRLVLEGRLERCARDLV
ncbi:MBL fold metallo-hydrolase [Bradyrhizobium sp. PRIMUS42]|uniref:MBL fold metallo-hydrolase n=1 Tax=Bradyrhizobium sp. PRIMUS42 TaxID=2908926 RepID=UPI001FF3A270|nr:MBL fold metallo-hydrolase [Bradyrhizobium sp. PRIMUS42]MCJ9728673.1 MBL fold metallo-hydrolase [Bradyrhizobium sp. PRIMUS42]